MFSKRQGNYAHTFTELGRQKREKCEKCQSREAKSQPQLGFTGQYCVAFSCVLFVVFMPTVPMCKYMLFLE